MNFAALDFSTPDYMLEGMGIAIFAILGVFMLPAIGIIASSKELKKRTRIIVPLVLLVVGFFSITTSFNINHGLNEERKAQKTQNEKLATENLLKKYNLQEVRWSSSDTSVLPTTANGDGDLLVKTSSGENYIFKYHVDEKTSEPFLEDMPLRGGTAPTQAITAKSLLK